MPTSTKQRSQVGPPAFPDESDPRDLGLLGRRIVQLDLRITRQALHERGKDLVGTAQQTTIRQPAIAASLTLFEANTARRL